MCGNSPDIWQKELREGPFAAVQCRKGALFCLKLVKGNPATWGYLML